MDRGTQDAVQVMLVTLKLQHRINYMLQYLGACYSAILCDMTYQQNRCSALLCKLEQ